MRTQCTSVTDRRTNRITITNTVQCIASHGKNRKKHNPKFEVSDFADFSIHGISSTALKQCVFIIYMAVA